MKMKNYLLTAFMLLLFAGGWQTANAQFSTDIAVAALSPTAGTFCDGPQPVLAQVVNLDPVNPTSGPVSVEYYLDGVLVTTVSTSGALAPGGMEIVPLGIVNNKPGKSIVTLTGTYAGDLVPANNTASVTFFLQFNGTYTVGSLPTDHFATVKEAVDTINFYGLCGPTTILMDNGTEINSNIVLNTNTTSSTNTLTFRTSSPAVYHTIMAGVGTGTLDGIFIVNGSDYVTIYNMMLMENPANITAATQMEWGVALLKPDGANGVRNFVMKNCLVSLNKANTGSRGFYAANHTTASTTSLTVTATSGANSNIEVDSCAFTNVYNGIWVAGYNHTTSPYDLLDQNNFIGRNGGNIVTNFGGAATQSYGIYAIYQNNLTIQKDSVNGGAGTTTTLDGIYVGSGSNANVSILNNIVIVSSNATTSQLTGIRNLAGSSGTNNKVRMNGNTVKNCTYPTNTTGNFYGIQNGASPDSLFVFSNTVKDNSITGSGGIFYAIDFGTPVKGIVNGNTINNNSRTGTGGTFYGVRGGTSRYFVTNNVIRDNSIAAGSSTLAGIYNMSSPTFEVISGNSIYNLANNGTGSLYGIYTNSVAASDKAIFNNQVYGLSGGAGTSYGIYQAAGDTIQIYKNNVYNISRSGAAGLTYGIYVVSGSNNFVYNNFVSELKAPDATGTNAINGIYLAGGTNLGVHYNTVFLNASSTSATTFGTTALYASTTPTLDLRNNILVNNSTPVGTSLTVAYRRSTTTLTSYAATSNNNLFYAGVPGANNLIFTDGTNNDQTLATYQARVSTRDNVSVTENPPFMNVAVSPYNLHMQTTISTKTESGATPIAITQDYDGEMRNGSTPDIGADEFNGIPSFTCVAPTPGNTISSNTSLCFGESISLSLQNATSGTGVTYQWQSSPDGVTYSNIPGAILATHNTTPSVMTWYQCIVTCANGPVSATSTPVQVSFTHSVTSSAGASRCGAGSLSLTATGSAGTTINWYTAATGGTSVGTGSPWSTPVITGTTSYYVAAENAGTASITLGAGASTSASMDYRSPFDHYYGGMKSQYLITAAELSAAGLSAGNITSLAFDVVTPGVAYSSFNVSVGHTALTALSSTLQTGLTSVYTSASETPTAGIYTITFATPFAWDGTSNIIVETCWSNNNTGGTSATVKYDTKGFAATAYYRSDSQTPAALCAVTAGSGTLSSRPKMVLAGATLCSSPRVEVVATIGASPALTVTPDQEVCNNAGASISVTSTLADYDSYVWTPETDLYTDAGCTVPYVAGASASTVYVKGTTAGVVTYTCTANNSSTMCSNIATTDVTILPGVATITATPASLCNSGTSSLTLSPASGWGTATYQWMNSTDNVTFSDIVGANANSYTTPTLTDTMYYKLVVELGASVCEESDTATVFVVSPAIVSTTPGSHCGAGTVNLEAQGSAGTVIRWYDAMTGGTPLSTGNTFTTPSISATTDYYAEAGVINLSVNDSVGSFVLPVGPSSSGSSDAGIVITTTEDGVMITGAQIFVQGTGNITFQLQTSTGTPIATHIAAISGATTSAFYPVVFPATFLTGTAGTYRVLATAKDAGITWYYPAMTYPINSASGIVTITSGWGWGSTYSDQMRCIHNIDFYYEDVCASPRTAVTATISAAPAISVSATPTTICQGETTDLSATSTNDPNYDYEWDGGLTGSTQTVSPIGTTIYNVTATDNSGGTYDGCITTGSVTVSVNPIPINVTAIASDNSICNGESIDLSGTGDAGYTTMTTLFYENFENAGSIPANWGTDLDVDGNATSADISFVSSSTYPAGFSAYEGTYFGRFNSYTVNSGNSARLKMTSPISTTGLSNVVVDFAWTQDNGYSNNDRVEVQYSTDGSTWVTAGTSISRAGSVNTWTEQSVTLPSAADNQATLYIGLLFTSAYGNDCHFDSLVISADQQVVPDFTWTSSPAGYTSNSLNNTGVVPTATTDYILTAENVFGCTASATTTVTVNAIPVVNLGSDQTICDTTTITLDAGNPGSTYIWSTGGTSQTEDILGSDLTIGLNTVSVDVTSAAGCTGTGSVDITVTVCDGINDPSVSISIFPNPATDLMNLDLSQLPAGDYTVELISLQGQEVLRQVVVNDGTIVSVSLFDIATGTYLVRVSGNNDTFQNYISIGK